jgi:hypothetical protein
MRVMKLKQDSRPRGFLSGRTKPATSRR